MKTTVVASLAIALDSIIESPDNPRKHFDPAFIAELARSLKESGQFTPCLVRPHPNLPGKYELAAGATRLRAARLAKLERLDCLVRSLDDEQFLEVLTFENLKRRDLQPMEEARSYALLQKRLDGWTVEKIAQRSGVSADYVRDRLRLLRLAPAIVNHVEAGEIPLTHALELAKLNAEQQKELCDADAWDEGLWADEGGVSLFDDDDAQEPPKIVVSLRELKANIAKRFPIDLAADTTRELFPDLAKAVGAAEEHAMPVVRISDAYSSPEVAPGEAPILNERQWARADGTPGAKKCKHATQLGVGVIGRLRGQAFTVCVASTECRTHFGEEIRAAEERAAAKRSGDKKERAEEPWEKRARLDREAKAKFQPAIAPLKAAILAAIAKAPTTLGGPVDKLVATATIGGIGAWPKAKGELDRGTTPEDLMRYLAMREVSPNEYNAHIELPKLAKMFGVDAAAIVKAAKKAAVNQTEKPSPKGRKVA